MLRSIKVHDRVFYLSLNRAKGYLSCYLHAEAFRKAAYVKCSLVLYSQNETPFRGGISKVSMFISVDFLVGFFSKILLKVIFIM